MFFALLGYRILAKFVDKAATNVIYFIKMHIIDGFSTSKFDKLIYFIEIHTGEANFCTPKIHIPQYSELFRLKHSHKFSIFFEEGENNPNHRFFVNYVAVQDIRRVTLMNELIKENRPTTKLQILDQSDEQFYGEVAQLARDNWSDGYIGKIVFTIDDLYMQVDGVKQRVDPKEQATPVIINNKVMLPVSALIKKTGGSILIDNAQQSITIEYDRVIEMKFGSNVIYIDSEQQFVNTVPVIMNDNVMLHTDIIADVFGFEVEWIPDAQQVILTRNFQTKRLILKSHEELDLTDLGAIVALKGLDNIAALQFATIQETIEVYARLSKLIEVVWVEPDFFIYTT